MEKPYFDENWNVINPDLNLDDWETPEPALVGTWDDSVMRQESPRGNSTGGNSYRRDHRCSRCGSENTQAFEVAHHSGSFEAGFSGSGYSYEAGRVNVSGTSYQQSNIAAYTSPPKRPRPYLPAIILTVAAPFFVGVHLIIAYLTSPIKFVIYSTAVIGVIVGAYVLCGMVFSPRQWAKYNHRVFQWQHSWICLRCGNTFYLQ